MSTAVAERVNTGAVQTAKKSPTMIDMLAQYKGEIARALPRHMTADRMTRIALTEFRKNPELQKCDPVSFMGAVVQCAQLGLEPGNGLGHAYLVPFYNSKRKVLEVQFIIGFRGMVALARRSGQIVSIQAHAVYDDDFFEYEFGLKPDLKHKPAPRRKPDAKITHFYAMAQLKDGGTQFNVMSVEEVNKVAKPTGPWKDHYQSMGEKTAVRRLFKLLPVSIELERAVLADEYHEAGVSQDNALVIEGTSYEAKEVESEDADATT